LPFVLFLAEDPVERGPLDKLLGRHRRAELRDGHVQPISELELEQQLLIGP